MRTIHKINRSIAKFEQMILILIVIAMVLLSFLQVVLRNVFDQGLLWGDTFLRHMVLWVGFIGASLATRDEKHINIDVLGRFLKGKYQIAAQIVINVFASLIAVFLSRAAWRFVMVEREFNTTIFSNIPAWYFQIIIPVGFAMMALRFLIITAEKSTELFSEKEQT